MKILETQYWATEEDIILACIHHWGYHWGVIQKECGGESVSGQECGGNKLWDNHFSFMAPPPLLMETDNSSSAFSRRGKDGKMIVWGVDGWSIGVLRLMFVKTILFKLLCPPFLKMINWGVDGWINGVWREGERRFVAQLTQIFERHLPPHWSRSRFSHSFQITRLLKILTQILERQPCN